MCLWLTFKLDNFQDIAHKVENLLTHSGPWKCSKDEDSGQIEAEFQMERASYITHIDLGKGSRLGVFFVFQIQLNIKCIYILALLINGTWEPSAVYTCMYLFLANGYL